MPNGNGRKIQKTQSLLTTANPISCLSIEIWYFCNSPSIDNGNRRKIQKMKKAERGVGLAVVNRDLVFFFSLMPFGHGRKLQKMKNAERGVRLAVVNRDLVFFFSLNANWPWKENYKR